MNLRPIRWTIWAVMGCMFFWSGNVLAQTSGDSQLRIRLRYSDGVPVTDESVILQRLPEEESVLPALRQAQGENCFTDTNGMCTWNVGRGL